MNQMCRARYLISTPTVRSLFPYYFGLNPLLYLPELFLAILCYSRPDSKHQFFYVKGEMEHNLLARSLPLKIITIYLVCENGEP